MNRTSKEFEELPELGARWARIALLLLMALITYWLLVPSPPGSLTDFKAPVRSDWLLHFCIYGTVSFFFISCQKKSFRIWGLVFSLLHALFSETLQILIPSRHFDTSDLLANMLGILLGGLLWICYRTLVLRYGWVARLLSSAAVGRLNNHQL